MTDRDRTADPELDDDEPIDPDIALITDWLAHELSPEDEAMVEKRLEEDFEFFEKVAPVMNLWHDPVFVRELTARAEADTKPRFSASERTAGPQGIDPSPQRPVREGSHRYAATVPEEAELPATDVLTERRLRRAHLRSNLYKGALFVYSIAATYLIVFGLPTKWYVKHTATPHDIVTTRAEWTPTAQPLPHGVMVETDATHTKEITLRGGSRVALRPNSRFTYEYIAGPIPLGVMAILDGEAAIDLSRGDKRMVVHSSAAEALMLPGNYALRCEPGCAAMMMTVGAGVAMIRYDSTKTGLSLRAGEKGMVPKGGAAEKVEPGTGWPALEPAKPAEGSGAAVKSLHRGR
jgi:hypothetical protein